LTGWPGAIESVITSHPLRVAVDGPPAAGKTTLADELALLLRSRGREVIRASTESFHLPRAQRYRRGEFSPEANYHDSFDYDTLRRVLLDPLGPDGDRRYQHAVYDLDTDTALSPPATAAPADAVLLLDGVFLLRPELIGRWDLSIFVSGPSSANYRSNSASYRSRSQLTGAAARSPACPSPTGGAGSHRPRLLGVQVP
jgi:uridine kinase